MSPLGATPAQLKCEGNNLGPRFAERFSSFAFSVTLALAPAGSCEFRNGTCPFKLRNSPQHLSHQNSGGCVLSKKIRSRCGNDRDALAYCVAVPLITMVSTKASQTVKFFGFPVARFAAGTLFILNFAIFRFVVTYGSMDRDTVAAFDELKETNYEFAFMVLAICFLTLIVSSSLRKSSLPASRDDASENSFIS